MFGEERLGVGREVAKQFLRDTPKVTKEIDAAIRKAVKEGKEAEDKI